MKYIIDYLKYDSTFNTEKNWLVEEVVFDPKFVGKTESIMNIGNGYIGIRSCSEENYAGVTRNTFIAGTFNKFDDYEVTELPNIPDVLGMQIFVDGQLFSLLDGEVTDYVKRLNIKTGELSRTFSFKTKDGKNLKFDFSRYASLANIHVIEQHVKVTTDSDCKVVIKSGINGQVTNSGSQHFHEGEKRFYESEYMIQCQQTTQSKIDVVIGTVHKFSCDVDKKIFMERRQIMSEYVVDLKANKKVELTKTSVFNTSRDKVNEGLDIEGLKDKTLLTLKEHSGNKYAENLQASADEWAKYWASADIEIDGDDYAHLALRFSMYHMRVFTPYHDNRMNIGAKGLSGEGYKGHTFWDTEIFLLPVYIFTKPEVARKLIEYRYLGLQGARAKAKGNGFKGAQYPWEAAWITDGEVTPVWGAADIITGKSTKIWSGFIEQHITCDVVYGVWLYYNVTKDQDFMDKYGYEIIFDTANFWSTRAEWDGTQYNLNEVIGPDEYKEHIDNNAFTNYMAKWNLDLALEYYEKLKDTDIVKGMDIEFLTDQWVDVSEKIKLQVANEDNIIAQDDTYLTLESIDLTKYKNQENVGSMFFDYNLEQVNKIQVSKQADIMVLFLLRESLFSKQTKIDNFNYYEPRTLHDSSLSLSTHVVLASDLGRYEMASGLFKKACDIDLGPNMKTSDHGIHAASLGGVWQGIVYGFGGVRYVDEGLRIEPHMMKHLEKIKFNIVFEGQKLEIIVTDKLCVKNLGTKTIEFINYDNKYEVKANNQVIL